MTDIEKFVNSFHFDRLYIFLNISYFTKNLIIFFIFIVCIFF